VAKELSRSDRTRPFNDVWFPPKSLDGNPGEELRWEPSKAYYQAFFWVLIDLIVELLVLIIKPFDNQKES
jgi:hypothetical protein